MTKELIISSEVKLDITKLDKQASEIAIFNKQTLNQASVLSSGLRRLGNMIKSIWDKDIAPQKTILDQKKAYYSLYLNQIKTAEAILDQKLLVGRKLVEEQKQEERKKLLAGIDPLAEMSEENKLALAETTNNKMVGGVSVRHVRKLKITDESLIPDKYWVIDEVALRKDLMDKVKVPGAELVSEETIMKRVN